MQFNSIMYKQNYYYESDNGIECSNVTVKYEFLELYDSLGLSLFMDIKSIRKENFNLIFN
jgi:hypothetical protein